MLVAILSLVQAGNSQGLSDEQARERAKVAVRNELGLNESEFLNPHRLESLEEAIIPFTPLRAGKKEKDLYFFEISHEGVENLSGNVVHHSSSDGHPVQYVAVSRSGGKTYGLYGLKNPEQEFNRMTSDLQFHVDDEANATLFALLYIQCVMGGSETVIYSPLDVKHLVENYFYGHVNNPERARQKSDKWWSGFEKAYRSRKFGLHAMKVAQGFRVSFDQATLREGATPRVDEYSLEISALGQCSSKQVKTLYPI